MYIYYLIFPPFYFLEVLWHHPEYFTAQIFYTILDYSLTYHPASSKYAQLISLTEDQMKCF